ncbi:MAG: alpha/beta fold hydrolase [Alphaproteobacteria bacterium]|nr:alpha/beta fold hydrolase [Alphaproteobacteria bacterium]
MSAEAVVLPTPDGHAVPARLFRAEAPRAFALINGAVGVRQRYYRRFAAFLAENGVETLTYDYRGVGEARPARLRGCPGRLSDWGSQDFPTALRWMHQRAQGRPLSLIGHSFGGQALAFLPDDIPLAGIWLVAAQLGQLSLWPSAWDRLRIRLFWGVFTPLLTRTLGYYPRQAGMGEDLPAGVARQWARWGLSEGYLLSEFPEAAQRLAAIRAPVIAVALADDTFYAPAVTVDALLALLTSAPVDRRLIAPAAIGVPEIGHFGFFRDTFRETLWTDALQAIERWSER